MSAVEQVERAVEEFGAGLEEFKSHYNAKLTKLENYLAKMEAKAGRPGAGGAGFDLPDGSEVKAARKGLNDYLRSGEFKALTVADDPQSGYFVPTILQQSIITKLYDTPTLLGLVRTQTWSGPGSTWREPLKRALLTARRRGGETETATDTGATDPVGMLEVPAGEAEALITLSQMLLDDAAYDLSNMVVQDMDAAFDRQIDAEIISGTGTGNQAQGFLNQTPVTTSDTTRAWGTIQYVPSGDANLVTADSLKNLVYTLRAPYRTGAAFAMNSTTASSIDKLKDGDGSYLWRESFSAGQAPGLLGFPVYFDENMPAVSAGNFPIAFANWKLAYVVAKKNQTRLLRDPYTSKPNLVLYGYKRQGGAVANSEAIKVMKVGTT